jgi:putative hydrolase of the HAD superfamily
VINGTKFRGVITDWGGVLTTPILSTVQAWIEADGIDWNSYRTVMRSWVLEAYRANGVPNPVHTLERGECSGAEFEQILAAQLLRTDGEAVTAEGLLQRMFAASARVPAMYDVIRTLRGAGLRTALLSNSWGCDEYPRADFPGLFDTVVISGECGMRKPEQGIFLHTAGILGLEPRECVFIDDIEANVAAAEACGMTGVHPTLRRHRRRWRSRTCSASRSTSPGRPRPAARRQAQDLRHRAVATRCDNRAARR